MVVTLGQPKEPAMRKIQELICKYIASKDGTVAIVFSLSMIPALGVVGLAIDYGRAQTTQTALQHAVDIAAMAAGNKAGAKDSERLATAISAFAANFNSVRFGKVTPVITPGNNTIRVRALVAQQTSFMQLFDTNPLTVSAEATSTITAGTGRACMLALHPTAYDALHVQGSNRLSAASCWVWANSRNKMAITGNGGAVAVAAGFCSHGGVSGTENYTPAPKINCPTVADPYADLAAPAIGSCNYTNKQVSNGTVTLSPGVYCGGLEAKPQATVIFNPGVYIMKNGPLKFQAGSTGSGNGVVFYFTGSNSTLELKGGANVTLKAPASGTLAGFLFVQDKKSSVGATTTIQGGGSVKLEGVVYMPTQTINIGGSGDFNMTAKHFGLVAATFYLQGNGTLALTTDAAGAGIPDVMPPVPGTARLTN